MEPDVSPAERELFLDIVVRQHMNAGGSAHGVEGRVQAVAMVRFARLHIAALREHAQRGGTQLYQSIGVLGGLVGAIEELLASQPEEHDEYEPDTEPEESDEEDEAEVDQMTSDSSTRSSTPEREIGDCPGNHLGGNRDCKSGQGHADARPLLRKLDGRGVALLLLSRRHVVPRVTLSSR
jgi:hypothetical protein